MDTPATTIVLCTCEDTMAPDGAAVAKACPGTTIRHARHLCRSEAALFSSLAGRSGDLVIGCTQEAPLFRDLAEDGALPAALTFVNIRETAGWSSEGRKAGPKTAALIAAARVPVPPITPVTLSSEGVALILGLDQVAVDLAKRLADRLDVTVLLTSLEAVLPPRDMAFPIRQGRVRNASGWLGAFELVIDGFAEPKASSRGNLIAGPARDGLTSKADIVIDLTGDRPLFPAPELRAGYLRADPGSPVAVAELLFRAGDLVGTFDKPKYIDFKADLCAHSRSRITGCTRCLDLCPTGAITPAGDHVAISPEICAGCGACAAACPTGAASYALPPADALIGRLRALLMAYRAAGGREAVVLIHDLDHGASVIDALARHGDGLPANVLPVAVNEVTQVGVEALAAIFAYGGAAVRCLVRAKPKHDVDGLRRTIDLAHRLVAGQGYGEAPVGLIETDDPDQLLAALLSRASATPSARPSSFLPIGAKRDVMVLALRELHAAAPAPVPVIPLEAGAPLGRVKVDVEGCTLCLSCVSACPVSALGDNADRPMLTFDESLCVQCGLCAATCPEKVITLEPRVNVAAYGAKPVIVKEEEPALCTRCGKAFGVKSTIERVAAKLQGHHWMYAGENLSRADVIRMCDDCRVVAMTEGSFDPYGAPERPRAKTSEDYIREREAIERLRQENRGKG